MKHSRQRFFGLSWITLAFVYRASRVDFSSRPTNPWKCSFVERDTTDEFQAFKKTHRSMFQSSGLEIKIHMFGNTVHTRGCGTPVNLSQREVRWRTNVCAHVARYQMDVANEGQVVIWFPCPFSLTIVLKQANIRDLLGTIFSYTLKNFTLKLWLLLKTTVYWKTRIVPEVLHASISWENSKYTSWFPTDAVTIFSLQLAIIIIGGYVIFKIEQS